MILVIVPYPGSVFSLMSAEDRDRLKRVTELAKQQVDGQQSHGNSDRGKPPVLHHEPPALHHEPPALHHEPPQAQPQTSSKFSLEREFEFLVNECYYWLVLKDTLSLLSNLTLFFKIAKIGTFEASLYPSHYTRMLQWEVYVR